MVAITARGSIMQELVAKLLSGRRPYRLAINHNVGPPLYERCPVEYTWRRGKLVGIETNDREKATEWVLNALTLDYEVSRIDERKNVTASDSIRRAEFRDRVNRMTPKELDDEIPF